MTDKTDPGAAPEQNFEIERAKAREDVRAWIALLSEEERRQPQVAVGERLFTPLEALDEIERGTAHGRLFVDRLTAHRMEAARRAEEIDVERTRLED